MVDPQPDGVGVGRSSPSHGEREKRWERFGRRPSSLANGGPLFPGPRRRSLGNLRALDSEAVLGKRPSASKIDPSSPEVGSPEQPVVLESVAQGAIRGSERCILAIRVAKLVLSEEADQERGGLWKRKGTGRDLEDSRVDDTKRRILAICEGKKSSSMLKLHKITDLSNGKASISRTWWLTELTQIDGLGEEVDVGSSFVFTFGGPAVASPGNHKGRRHGFQVASPRDRAVFLWTILQICASKVGRAPPVRGLKILEMQKVADMASPRNYASVNAGGARRSNLSPLQSPETPQQGGTGPSFAPIKSPRSLLGPFARRVFGDQPGPAMPLLPESEYQGDVGVDIEEQSDTEIVQSEKPIGVCSPKIQAAEDRVKRKIQAQEKANQRDKEARGKAIQAYSDALDQMPGPAESMTVSQRGEYEKNRRDAITHKERAERELAARKELEDLRLSPKEAEDLETVFQMYASDHSVSVHQKEFVDHLAKKMRQLEKENIREIIYSESEVGTVTESLQNLAGHIDGTKLWLKGNESRLSLCASTSTTLENELLLHEIQLKNIGLLQTKITEIEEAITLSDYESFTIKYASKQKMIANENGYMVEEMSPALKALKRKMDYRPKHEAMNNFPLIRDGRKQLVEYRDAILDDLFEVLELWVREISSTQTDSCPRHESKKILDFGIVMEAAAPLKPERAEGVMTLYGSLGSVALTKCFDLIDDIPASLELRLQLRQCLAILRPVCREESVVAYQMFASCATALGRSPSECVLELVCHQLQSFGDVMSAMVREVVNATSSATYLAAWAELHVGASELKIGDGRYGEPLEREIESPYLQQALLSVIETRAMEYKREVSIHAESISWASTRAAEAVGQAALKPEGIMAASIAFRSASACILDLTGSLLGLVCLELVAGENEGTSSVELPKSTSIREVPSSLSSSCLNQLAIRDIVEYTKSLCHRLVAGVAKNIEVASQISQFGRGDAIRIENFILIVKSVEDFPHGIFLRDLCDMARKATRVAVTSFVHRLFNNHFGRAVDGIIGASQSKNPSAGIDKLVINEFGHPSSIGSRIKTNLLQYFCPESTDQVYDRCWGELTHHSELQLTGLSDVLGRSGLPEEQKKLSALATEVIAAMKGLGGPEPSF